MNLLQKQGIFNSITLYIGIGFGFFNSIILYQRFLTLDEIGYIILLTTISMLYTQLSSVGFSSVISRYFPFYKTQDNTHSGFPTFVMAVCLLGFLVITVLFVLFKELVFSFYTDGKGISLLSKYYYYIIPISFFTLAFLVQEFIARSVFKSILPTFLREVLLKVFTSTGIVMIMLKWIDFDGFLTFYLVANIIIVVILSYYNYQTRIYRPALISKSVLDNAKPMMNYGLFSMITGSAVAMIPSFGTLILKMINGEAMVGIFGTFLTMAAVINLPAKALSATSYQIVADSWKDENMDRIKNIYYKTSIIQLLIGKLILIGLIINQKNLVYLLHKPEYAVYFNVFIILGLGYLIDITGGLNSAIISYSKYYKVVMRFLMVTALLSGILNFLLISQFGIFGAAWSYVATMLFLNFGYWLYIKVKFKIQPFGKRHLYSLIIGLVCLFIGMSIPDLTNYYFDVFVRSSIVTIVYIALVYWLNISEDINDLLNKVLKKKS